MWCNIKTRGKREGETNSVVKINERVKVEKVKETTIAQEEVNLLVT